MNPSGSFYRRMAGGLLLWSLIPLPFLYTVMVPFWIVAVLAGAAVVIWPETRPQPSRAVLNLIGVVILVLVFAAGGVRVGPLRPLGHLLLLLTVVRVALTVDRRSFLKALPAIFVVWVIALTASTHVTVLLYFAASAVVWWWVGMQVHLSGITENSRNQKLVVVRPRHAVGAALAAVLLAIPVFVAVPRLRSPWIAGRGGMQSVTGFSSRVELSGVGTIQESQERALRVRSVEGEPIQQEWMRLRATAFDRVTVDSWAPRAAARRAELRDGLIWLFPSRASLEDTVELGIELSRPDEYLFLPEGTIAVRTTTPVRFDPAGGLRLVGAPEGQLHYGVWVARGERPRRTDPPNLGARRFRVHPEVRRLATEAAAGLSDVEDVARAIERHLQTNFSYSMKGMTHLGRDPVSWFLVKSKAGHCEYFAGGMVVLLDTLGVQARMVGGYSGGMISMSGDEVVVRESNAHTWVEVWLGAERGWEVFDPTPAASVPGLSGVRATDRIRFAWEWIQASWDRYVLTFGLGEQMSLLIAAGDRLAALVRDISWRSVVWPLGGMVLLALAVAAVRRASRWTLRARRGLRRTPAARVVARLVRRLEQDGVEVPPGATVRGIGRSARLRWPRAGAAVSELVWLAERELYADGSGAGDSKLASRKLWKRLRYHMTERDSSGAR
jgi:transglutaminase-like putative cysteine protease